MKSTVWRVQLLVHDSIFCKVLLMQLCVADSIALREDGYSAGCVGAIVFAFMGSLLVRLPFSR